MAHGRMATPFVSRVRLYGLRANRWAVRNPLKLSIAVTTFKAGAADLLVQRCIEGNREVDVRRLSTFLLFGCFYQGCFQYFVFARWLETLFPGPGPWRSLQKVSATLLFFDPILFFPSFYTIQEALARPPHAALQYDTVRVALGNYRENCFGDWQTNLICWVPGHSVTFGLCSTHWRMPWVATLSFGYLCVLSLTRGRVAVG
jgi:hypothetical protein